MHERPTPTRSPQRHRHWTMLWLAAVISCAAFALEVHGGERVALRILPEFPLPHSCVSRAFGFECPGCGLTRSFVCLADGDPRRSLAMHPAGWLLALFTLLQFPYRGYALWRGVDHPLGKPFANLVAAGLSVTVVLAGVVRLLA